jgi:cation diffusion facilitator CzcD-associated flavoprotein CzcO
VVTDSVQTEVTGGTGPLDYDVVIVGAGFGGLYALHHLRSLGLRCILFDAAPGVGGTWYWNRYPGARVDIESTEYCFSFSKELQQEWTWSERFAGQPELLRYLNHVADRFDLRKDIQLSTTVTGAELDESTGHWTVSTDVGGSVRTNYCVMAVGLLTLPKLPDIPGLSDFQGEVHHTGAWPEEPVDLTGKRVGVIGTGASAVQLVPVVAEQAAELYAFQRSKHFAVPMHNCPITPEYDRWVKENYDEIRRAELDNWGGIALRGFKITPQETRAALDLSPEEVRRAYEEAWEIGTTIPFFHGFVDHITSEKANQMLADFFAGKVRELVHDEDVADRLVPRDHPILTKRLCGAHGYYEAFNRDNVTLVDLLESPIDRATDSGIRLANGQEYRLDTIICATGFDAATGPLVKMDVRGRGGKTLREHWSEGIRTHLGMVSNGFPNMFFVNGPHSPAAFFQPVLLAEIQGRWIGDLIQRMRATGATSVEPTTEAEDAWAHGVDEMANATLIPLANSWWMGANIPGKPRQLLYWPGPIQLYLDAGAKTVNDLDGMVIDGVDELAA